jgi:hypothetical protein
VECGFKERGEELETRDQRLETEIQGGFMKKTYLIFAAFLAMLCSCAAPQEKTMTEAYWTFSRPVLFTPENLLSKDPAIKDKAMNDYSALEQDSKEKVITYIAYMLADEKDALARHEIFDLLRDINAGPFVVAPLVRAYGAARSETRRAEISQFINEYKLSELELPQLIKLFAEKDWDTKIKAIRVLSSMKAAAGPALPEIINAMHETGPSYGLYEEVFDFAAKINMEAMLAAAALDLAAPVRELRESALRKMYQVYIGGESAPSDRQSALKTMVRIMFKGEPELSGLSKKLLEKSGTDGAKAAAAEFEAYNNMKVKSMKDLTTKKMNRRFANEEDDMYLTLKLYYIKQGRNDAVKTIFDPAKSRI